MTSAPGLYNRFIAYSYVFPLLLLIIHLSQTNNGLDIHIVLETSIMLSHNVLGLVPGRGLTNSSSRTGLENKTNVEQASIHANEVSPNLGPVKSNRRQD